MPVLNDYEQFGYTHWETGTVARILSYTMDSPISEALLFGMSGGIVTGYQMSDGKNPSLNLITRTPFNPLDTIIERLKLPTDDRRTSNPERAARYLHEALADGHPVIVWIDINVLPYQVVAATQPIQPIIVYGIDDKYVYIADRAHEPFRISVADFQQARDGAASEQYRQMTIGVPQMSRLALAVRLGIESCLRDFLEESPIKDLHGKFGLATYEYWASKLERGIESGWRKKFPRGRKLTSVLLAAYQSINYNGTGGNGSRAMFADFLDEAADMLDKPPLKESATHWRDVLPVWDALNDALLPLAVEEFAQLRHLMQREHDLFITQGMASHAERQQIQQDIDALQHQIGRKFPLTKRQTGNLLDNLRDAVCNLAEVESAAVEDLKAVMLAVSV